MIGTTLGTLAAAGAAGAGETVHRLWTTAATQPTPTQPLPGIDAPEIEYTQLAPILIVVGVSIVGMLVEAFVPRRWRYRVQVPLALAGLVAGFVAVIALALAGYASETPLLAAEGAVAVDGPALFLQGTVLLVAVVAVLTFAERRLEPRGADEAPVDSFAAQAATVPGSVQERKAAAAGFTTTEVYPLALFAVAGMLVFPAAADLLTMFVALEVLSLPLYILCGLARRRRLLSQEAAMKYFLLGAFASAFFLFGVAMLYGYAGTTSLSGIADTVAGYPSTAAAAAIGNDALLLTGLGLVAVGLLFKIGAVPFHAWTPDVYQGAPTPVTGFMAAATKVAAFGALLRLLYVALPGLSWDWRPVMWGVAIATMVVGAVVAVTQTDVKRLLAYSSIAHAGFLLTGAVASNEAGISSVLFYLAAYSFVTLGAFAVVTLVRDAGGEATHLSRWDGLGRRSPVVATAFAIFLLAFAGIPLTSGFIGKFAVFSAAAEGGATPLVIVGVLCSAVAAFFYVRVIVRMFFNPPRVDGPTVAVPSPFTTVAIALGVAVTVALGLLPQAALDLADAAAVFAG
ncbi:NADH-quinone oxidoreductase subunit NuoN [Allostreptomyces psammosilenae]|uniref:NADH-quinone oxidoreductase subunit N n=1 Tax=Allostreptomyces psammosilenae TaxID=1892865 RepID=A0A853A5T0_9ACTN|nr:NADH-quinone oxidoreductase subunit NuoN [Allostreptomyces psammosilenae]NYI05842.1 NADH-quinone oxidoreductase subunit N [Allostreptomyces psammosilenae]